MSITYDKSTNFTAKDSMATTNPDKLLSGVPFDFEFDAISAAFEQAAPTLDATFTGTTTTDVLVATTVNGSNTSDWDTAYGWGDHGAEGYLTTATETDPTVPAHVKTITTTDISHWDTAYGWGDHSTEGYVVTETDPVFLASDVAGVTTSDIANWDEAYDDSITAMTFDETTGVLTATKEDSSVFTVGLDGRYATIAGVDTYSAGDGLVMANNVFSHDNTSDAVDVENTGQTFIQQLLFDDYGHVVSVSSGTAVNTNTTYSAGDTIAINGSNQISHGNVPNIRPGNNSNNSGNTFIQDITFDQYGHVTDFATGTAAFTNTDTTYTASGNGLNLTGTAFSHANTSSASSVSNSNQTFIKDLTFDEFGHVTGYVSQAAVDTNNTYSGGTNITLSSTLFNLDTTLTGLVQVETETAKVGVFTITTRSNGFLEIKIGNTKLFELNSDGDLRIKGNVTAYTTGF